VLQVAKVKKQIDGPKFLTKQKKIIKNGTRE